MQPVLSIQGYSKSYGDATTKAVDNLNLEVMAGEIFGFIGHNGAGKTTTLRAIAGVLSFEEGDIFVDGHSVKTDAIAAKSITAYIPDNPDMYEFMTGIAYLNLLADLYSIDKPTREARIALYAGKFDFVANLGSPISSYSHGMKQKLALISAFMREPRLLILDEPFVGLDPVASHTLKGMLAELCAAGGCVFFSTHVLEVAEKLCHRIAIIKAGQLVVHGRTEEVVGSSSLVDIFLEQAQEGGAQA
ncbi:ABC transporter ATP-binding protein [Ruminococcaceae bacterium OttesenSCG-928-N02]|nr:ABC transporter ATP-binding protein [Ruminococcaceae bacterium OttesenSCG-928-N02]